MEVAVLTVDAELEDTVELDTCEVVELGAVVSVTLEVATVEEAELDAVEVSVLVEVDELWLVEDGPLESAK